MLPSARSSTRRRRSASTARRRTSPAEPELSDIERKNIELIVAYENRVRGELSTKPVSTKLLDGLFLEDARKLRHEILQTEPAHQRPQGQALDHQRAEHHAEGDEEYEIPLREPCGKRKGGGERDRPPHPAPGYHSGVAG